MFHPVYFAFLFRMSALFPGCNTPAYMTPSGMVISAPAGFAQPASMIDYGQSAYASHFAAANASPFAQDVAASVAAGTSVTRGCQ